MRMMGSSRNGTDYTSMYTSRLIFKCALKLYRKNETEIINEKNCSITLIKRYKKFFDLKLTNKNCNLPTKV